MESQSRKRERWLAIGAAVAKGNPRQYTRSELESVLIGVRPYDNDLAAKIAAMIEASRK